MPEPEKVALFDMDGSLADLDKAMTSKLMEMASPLELASEMDPRQFRYPYRSPPWLKARKHTIKREPGFWEHLDPIQFGLDLYQLFGDLGYRRMILTRGPRKNSQAWAEKVRWCERYVPNAEITVTLDKGLVYGKILYDDYPPYIEAWLKWRPRGKVIMLDAPMNQDFQHPQVLRVTREPLADQRDTLLEFIL